MAEVLTEEELEGILVSIEDQGALGNSKDLRRALKPAEYLVDSADIKAQINWYFGYLAALERCEELFGGN